MELYKLCNTFLDYVQATGKIILLYGAGGYLHQRLTGAPRACGVMNNPELEKVLKMSDIAFVGSRQ
jgi:proteasome assembly chaperone (PAC2) family protein